MTEDPRLVYFDRSAWSSLIRDEDAGGKATQKVRLAVKTRKIDIVVSDAVLDETLPLFVDSPDKGARHVDLLIGLAAWKKGLIRLPKDLVREQALAIMEGRRRPPALGSARKVLSLMKALPTRALRDPNRIAEVARGISQKKAAFEASIQRERKAMLAMKQKAGDLGRPPTLRSVIRKNAPDRIQALLNHLGIGSVSDDDLQRILGEPAPRMYASVHIAYVYFQVVRKWAPQRGDGYDLLHAVAATVADEFVSDDERLREISRAGGEGHSVVWDLSGFVRSLAS